MGENQSGTPISPEQHTIPESVILHLLPGVLAGIVYFALAQPIRNLGFPSLFALLLAFVFVQMPFQIGFLLYKKKAGGDSWGRVIPYRKRLPLLQYLIWVPFIILASGLIFILLRPISDFLASLFSWLPEVMILDPGLSEAYSRTSLILTYALLLVVGGVMGPSVEEAYFRGYLLPRMPLRQKRWNPILHSFLMALYHTWTPWMVVARTASLLPLVYVVQRKENIYLGMISHCLLNMVDVISGVAFILGTISA
jgi:membrane protease YdiL (CAAX protease family)